MAKDLTIKQKFKLIDLKREFMYHDARTSANLLDGAAYGYVNGMIQALENKGEDPTKYEVILVRDEYPSYTDDKLLITQRIRLAKIGEING